MDECICRKKSTVEKKEIEPVAAGRPKQKASLILKEYSENADGLNSKFHALDIYL